MERKIDMPHLELNRIEEREPVEGFKVRFVHSEKMTIVFFQLPPDRPYRSTHTLTSRFPLSRQVKWS